MNQEKFIQEVLQLWMEEHQQQGTIVVEKRPPTELALPQTAKENGLLTL